MKKKKSNNKWLYVAGLFLIWNEYSKRNNKPPIFNFKNLPFNYNGFILPPLGIFIKTSEKQNQNLIDHEMMHWKQYQREGLLNFLSNYSKENKAKGYDLNKYEIEARFNENDFCKVNYTECVRKGLAKTVYNPNFRKLKRVNPLDKHTI